MAVSYQQTDTAAPCGLVAACSGGTVGTGAGRDCVGTAGTTPVTAAAPNGATRVAFAFEITPPAGTTWDAGNWVVRLNVTTANVNYDWDDTYICRVNSGCTSQATIGSLTAQNISLATAGVQSMTISGAAETPGGGDKVYVVIILQNKAGHGTHQVAITPSELIDSPFTAAATKSKPFNLAQGSLVIPQRRYA